MRQEHRAGEALCVDWAGMTVPIVDLLSGSQQPASIFVAVLAASNYSYAEATLSQALGDWIGAHCRAFAFFGGVTRAVVPDNTKTGISKACFYEPDLNVSYLEMANHYGTAILPVQPDCERLRYKEKGFCIASTQKSLSSMLHFSDVPPPPAGHLPKCEAPSPAQK